MANDAPPTAPERSAKEQFDKQASHYDAQWNSWNEESLAWMIGNSEHKRTDTLLDVATGAGYTALGFAPYVCSVIGVDVSAGMLAQARKQAEVQGIVNAAFQEAPAEKLPFPDASFDIVTCRVAAHHFLDVRKFAREAARVLKPRGRLLVADTTVPDDDEAAASWQNEVEVLRDPSHVKNYTPSEWRAIVEDAGLRIEAISDAGGGITIPLDDWMTKSGCDEPRRHELRERFLCAPANVKEAFGIKQDSTGEIFFTWPRVVLKARSGL